MGLKFLKERHVYSTSKVAVFERVADLSNANTDANTSTNTNTEKNTLGRLSPRSRSTVHPTTITIGGVPVLSNPSASGVHDFQAI